MPPVSTTYIVNTVYILYNIVQLALCDTLAPRVGLSGDPRGSLVLFHICPSRLRSAKSACGLEVSSIAKMRLRGCGCVLL